MMAAGTKYSGKLEDEGVKTQEIYGVIAPNYASGFLWPL